MKKITFIFSILLASCHLFAQNLVTNGDFEANASTYTVVESSVNVLKRVTDFYDGTTQTTNPTLTASDAVATGQWVKRALNDAVAEGVIVTTTGAAHAGTSCLNLKVATSNNAAYTNSLALLAVQKVSGLSNSKRYLVTFWAKQDGTASNNCGGVNIVLGDNVVKSTTNPLMLGVILTGSTTWTQYTAVLDLPKYIISNPTADFSTAEFGFAITTKVTTAYSGVLIDDVEMTELTTPTIAYVKPTATGTGDGSSWENASADIQAAINSITYGEVRVAAGTYTPTATITLKDGVNLVGAYAADGSGTRDLWNNKTILDGAGNKQIIMNSNSANPFKYETKVDGFILQNGYTASGNGSAASLSLGVVLENCIIRNNIGVTGTNSGAAVFFGRNVAISGSGYSKSFQATGALINCIIINNSSAVGAGAVHVGSSSLCSIINCVIANNTCSDATGAGGIYLGNSAHWTHVQNCILYNNVAATATYNNMRSYNNTALYAILNNWFGDSTLPFAPTTDTRSICGNNLTNASPNSTPGFEQPTSFQGATTDPQKLAEFETCNWRLKSTSTLIGLANSTQVVRFPYENLSAILTSGIGRSISDISTDVMGGNRIANSTIDLGAYEYNPVVVTAASGDETKGSVSGGRTVSKGTSVTLTATPASGQRFIKWNDGTSDVSTAAVYTFIPTTDVTVTATFDLETSINPLSTDNFLTVNGRVLTKLNNSCIDVYNIAGTLVQKADKNTTTITLPRAGVYVIKVTDNDRTMKFKLMVY